MFLFELCVHSFFLFFRCWISRLEQLWGLTKAPTINCKCIPILTHPFLAVVAFYTILNCITPHKLQKLHPSSVHVFIRKWSQISALHKLSNTAHPHMPPYLPTTATPNTHTTHIRLSHLRFFYEGKISQTMASVGCIHTTHSVRITSHWHPEDGSRGGLVLLWGELGDQLH